MKPKIGVITVAIPERLHLLAENVAAIKAQTLQPYGHWIGIDYARQGTVANQNNLAKAAIEAGCNWIAQLADDDLADPDHLERLWQYRRDATVVYSWCRVVGRVGWRPNGLFDPERLQRENYIPATTLIKSTLIIALGYWREDVPNGWEDWDFWKRALAHGARFVCVPEITWTYRFNVTGEHKNKSTTGVSA